jgi:hypothetical protein
MTLPDDGGQAEFPDHPQRFAAGVRSGTCRGHTIITEIVHGFANSKACEGSG